MLKQKERDGEFCNFAVKDFHYLTSKTLLCKSSENELEVPQKWANLLSYMNDCDVVGWVDTMDWWSGLSASTVCITTRGRYCQSVKVLIADPWFISAFSDRNTEI